MTRPEAQSRRFADAFRARFGADWPVCVSPLTEIRFLDPGPLPDGYTRVIFTSQNAVAGFARLTAAREATAWCVGERTAEAARASGFRVEVGQGGASDLSLAIASAGAVGRALYPRGVHVARDIVLDLRAAGVEVIPLIVYEQARLAPTPEALALMASPEPVLLPLFSPRSARLAADAFPDGSARLVVAAISGAVAEAASSLGADRIVVAERPDAEAMLSALACVTNTA